MCCDNNFQKQFEERLKTLFYFNARLCTLIHYFDYTVFMQNNTDIVSLCEEWAASYLGENFKFRPNQLESCTYIIQNVLSGCKTQVMNAPTGSGKSITAMICAGVLHKYFDKTSYILVSDLSLFDQYVADFRQYGLDKEWGYLKGKDTYTCDLSNTCISCGMCQLNQVNANTLGKCDEQAARSLGYPCAIKCKYIQDRKNAIEAPVTLMTYKLYLIQRNYVADKLKSHIFEQRDFVICDEAHKINDIIQQHFAPTIPHTLPKFMQTLDEYAKTKGMHVDTSSLSDIATKLVASDNQYETVKQMFRYEQILGEYTKINDILRKEVIANKKYKEYKKYLSAGNTARDAHCKFDDMFSLIKVLGNKIIVKTDNEKDTTIKCVYEGEMIKHYFHEKSGCELMMSATMGNLDVYKNMVGLLSSSSRDYKKIVIPSTFDFSKSPIYYSTKNHMSYANKAKALPEIIKQIIHICEKRKDERGIIQTGNYENVKKLKEKLPRNLRNRIIFYFTSQEKDKAIIEYLKNDNKILCGPTLLEGLNFDGDKCRFAICMKLPYASLADNFVKAKKAVYKDWYVSDVIAKLEQGIGRLVRYNGDYGAMYILDGCVSYIVNSASRNLLSPTTISRLVEYRD